MQSHSKIIEIIDPEFLLTAYCNGFFPMADSKTGEINWYSPDPRAIIDLEKLHPQKSLKSILKKNIFEIKINQNFEETIRRCSKREETWISEKIIQSYLKLNELGYAHSVETWSEGKLAGGLYGVAIGGAFFGESMFSILRDASKVALVNLVKRLNEKGFLLLDAQYITPHLKRFGAYEITRKEYLDLLNKSINLNCMFI